MGGQLPPSSFAPDSEQAYLHQQHALQQLSALESLAGQQAGPPMSAAGAGQLPSVPGLLFIVKDDYGCQQGVLPVLEHTALRAPACVCCD